MTRNEWIVKHAERLHAASWASEDSVEFTHALNAATKCADHLEEIGLADWQPAHADSDDEATAILRRWMAYENAPFGHEVEEVETIIKAARAHLARKDAK